MTTRSARPITAACSRRALLLVGLFTATGVQAQQPPAAPAPTAPPSSAKLVGPLQARLEIEPKAVDLLKAMSARLAAAKAMTFTATATYESPARTGEPLAYLTVSEVTFQRPDKLRVITPGDGAPSEFYYDGKIALAYDPQAKLVAVADATGSVESVLRLAYQNAAIYFPFTDVIVNDPYKDVSEGMILAFVVGASRAVGGVPTDVVAVATDAVHAQIWIGSEDKLLRMIRATFADDTGHFRHVVEFSNWKLDPAIPADVFTSADALKAPRIPFVRPELAARPPAK